MITMLAEVYYLYSCKKNLFKVENIQNKSKLENKSFGKGL